MPSTRTPTVKIDPNTEPAKHCKSCTCRVRKASAPLSPHEQVQAIRERDMELIDEARNNGGVRYGLILLPWEPLMDHRPKPPKGTKPGDIIGGGSAKHGECTECAKDRSWKDPNRGYVRHLARQATYRVANEHGNTQSSACEYHALHYSGQFEVPAFESPEDAQRWLDELTDALEGAETPVSVAS